MFRYHLRQPTYVLAFATACVVFGALAYWATGWAFGFGMHGTDSNQFIGYRQFFLSETEASQLALFFFEFTFASASATIVRYACACQSLTHWQKQQQQQQPNNI
jgi:ammonia channel protein AmtB